MEFLIRIAGSGQNDRQLAPGMVVDIHPDGWPWSDREKNNPDWLIIRSAVTLIEAEALMAAPTLADGITTSKRKKFALNGVWHKVQNEVQPVEVSPTVFRARVGQLT